MQTSMSIQFSIGGDLGFVEEVIRGILPIYTLSPHGETALVIAAGEGCINMIENLMSMYCADSNWSLNGRYVLYGAIIAAINSRQTAALIYLIRNESQLNYDHLLVMQICYRQCDLDLLKLLLNLGVDINATSSLQPSSVLEHATCKEFFDPEKYELLVRHSFEVSVSDEGFTVFHKAIMVNNEKALEILLRRLDANIFHEFNLRLTKLKVERLGLSSWDNIVNCAIKQQSSNMIKMLMGYVNEEALGSWMSCNREIYYQYKHSQSEEVPSKRRRMFL